MKNLDGQLKLRNHNACCFLEITTLKDVLANRVIIEDCINRDEVKVLALILDGNLFPSDASQGDKTELYRWLIGLAVPSIAVLHNECCFELFELSMMCDIRIGCRTLTMKFPEKVSNWSFDFHDRCQVLMGYQPDLRAYAHLLGSTMNAADGLKTGLLSQLIESNELETDTIRFVDKIVGNRDRDQIKAIMKCFKNYKNMGLNSDRTLLLEQEAHQFCYLTVKDYFKNEDAK